MSVSIHQIILDAKRLAGRLKERETVADALLSQTHAINRRIESMKHVMALSRRDPSGAGSADRARAFPFFASLKADAWPFSPCQMP